jgi:hypothetical protein
VDFPLYRRLPRAEHGGAISSDALLNAFLAYVEEKKLVLYSAHWNCSTSAM